MQQPTAERKTENEEDMRMDRKILRALAFAFGGHGLVAKLEKGEQIERRLGKACDKLIDAEFESAEENEGELVAAAVCEAIASLYARVVVMHAVGTGIDPAEAKATAHRALDSYMDRATEIVEKRNPGLANVMKFDPEKITAIIKDAADRGGKGASNA